MLKTLEGKEQIHDSSFIIILDINEFTAGVIYIKYKAAKAWNYRRFSFFQYKNWLIYT